MPDVAAPAPIADRPWRCASGQHVLGRVQKTGRSRVLEVWAEADDPSRVRVILKAGCVICSVCGSLREWHADEDALEEMLARRRR